MLYRITHTTTYRYQSPVNVCHNSVTLAPRASDRLSLENYRLSIRPAPAIVDERRDMFGNVIQRFSLEENHSQLVITATSRVNVISKATDLHQGAPTCQSVSDGVANRTDPNWLECVPFIFDSPRIRRAPKFQQYAAASIVNNKSIVVAATQLTSLIHSDFRYDKTATRVDTTPEKAFQGKHGVCQDFAQVMVACLRSHRLPAAYVSGYLRTHPPAGKERLVGADASHAWVAVYCGANIGWVEFDPTNDCLCGEDHIPMAIGRDYGDVVPIKGVFLGGGEPRLSVSVDVAPLD